MFCVYAVRVINGKKHRHYIDAFETILEAKHSANCCVCGNADYAYVKDTTGGTVFIIQPVVYDEEPLDPKAPARRLL